MTMPSEPLVVLADAPDDSGFVAVGPVYSGDAAVKLAKEIAEAGWKPGGVRRYLSRASFRGSIATAREGTDR
jgi:hypothetical protein